MAVNWDHSNIILNNRAGANIAEGIQQAAQGFGRGVEKYYEAKEKKEKNDAAMGIIKKNKELMSRMIPELANIKDPDEYARVAEAGLKNVGADNFLQIASYLEQSKSQAAQDEQLGQLRGLQIAQAKQQQAEQMRRMQELAGINAKADRSLQGASTQGILKPGAQADMMAFANSPAGQLRKQGVQLTPEMIMKTQASQPFVPQEMMTPSGLPMVQTSGKSWIPAPRVRNQPSDKPITRTFKVGNREYMVGPGDKYFDAKTGAPVDFRGNQQELDAVQKAELTALPEEIAALEQKIIKASKQMREGNKKPGPDWLPGADTYDEKIQAMQVQLAEKRQRLRRLGGGQTTGDDVDTGPVTTAGAIGDPIDFVLGRN